MSLSIRLQHTWACALLLLASSIISAQEIKDSASNANTVLKSLPLKANQGVAVDEKYLYAISNTEIRKHDKKTGQETAAWKADTKRPEFSHFVHMNSGTVIAGKLYCAHSRFPFAPNECTIEVWDVEGEKLNHVETIPMPATHGSLTWIDRRGDGSWWICFVVYGEIKNKVTKLIKCRQEKGKFIEEASYLFPQEVVAQWGAKSCSGGSWGPDDLLYITGHDRAEAYVLRIAGESLEYVRTERNLGLFGQAIAWDRSSGQPALWGLVKNKAISLTLIPAAVVNPP